MSTKDELNPLDKIESKLVFRISRTFFWILLSIAGLIFVGGILVSLYSLIPPSKSEVIKAEAPPEPEVTLADVMARISPPQQVSNLESSTPAGNQKSVTSQTTYTPPQQDEYDRKIIALYDTLKKYFPAEKYNWDPKYERKAVRWDIFNRPAEYQNVVVSQGVRSEVDDVLRPFQTSQKKVQVLEGILKLIKQIDGDNRRRALGIYVNLYRQKTMNWQQEVASIESAYQSRLIVAEGELVAKKLFKNTLLYFSLMGTAGAIILAVIIGLFLCFLAIERNTRSTKALISELRSSQ